MTDNRRTKEVAEWIDAEASPPNNGEKVLALTHANKLIECEWSKHIASICDAWSPFPKVPAHIRARQAARFKF